MILWGSFKPLHFHQPTTLGIWDDDENMITKEVDAHVPVEKTQPEKSDDENDEIWAFPESSGVTPSHHPFLDAIFPNKDHPAWSVPISENHSVFWASFSGSPSMFLPTLCECICLS